MGTTPVGGGCCSGRLRTAGRSLHPGTQNAAGRDFLEIFRDLSEIFRAFSEIFRTFFGDFSRFYGNFSRFFGRFHHSVW